MRKTLIISVTILAFGCTSKTTPNYMASTSSGHGYYISATGSDANSGTIDAPFKTIAKVNSISLQPGDNVLFKRGETFYGGIISKTSGTSAQPIFFGAYGEGNKPIVTGLTSLTNWTNVGGGKYEASLSTGTALSIVTLNNEVQAMGRTPNASAAGGGYAIIQAHNANKSITDAAITDNWVGAELVVRTNRYIIDRAKITAQSGSTLTYTPALSYTSNDGYGYFLQNDLKTLDQLGEWYYSPSVKKLTMFFGGENPSGYDVKASAVQNVITDNNFDNITFDNLDIRGANNFGVSVYSGTNVTVSDCDINFSGVDAVNVGNTNNLKVLNCSINGTNNIGVNLNSSTGGIIRGNNIKNTALLLGLGQNGANKSVGIRETGSRNLVEYNEIDYSGYMGIRFGGDYAVIKNNLINYFNITKDDGGGIYTTDPGNSKKIIGNIILNGVGAPLGSNTVNPSSTSGIYIDDYTRNVEVRDNTVANCNKSGIFLHNAHELTITGNTLFNNGQYQMLLSHNMTSSDANPLRNISFKNNIFFARSANQSALTILTAANDVSLSAGTMDSNYYCRPIDDNFVIHTQYVNTKTFLQDLDLALWARTYSKDANSNKTAITILPHVLNSLIGGNKFINGNFNSSVTGVNFGSTGGGVRSWNSSKLDGGTFQVSVKSAAPCLSTATIPVGQVYTSKKYIISFTAVSSKDTMLYVYARQASSPYRVLSNGGTKTIVNITGNRRDYALAFSPTINNAITSIFLESPVQQGTFWLDNIKIYEADVNITNPSDSIRLEYNASLEDRVIQLPGKYIDARGVLYNGSISLAPYQSAVLIKKGDIYNPPPPPPPVDTLPPPVVDTATTIKLINNDNDTAQSGATIHLSAVVKAYYGIRKVEFFNGKILMYTSWKAPFYFSWENIPAGNYTFTARLQDLRMNLIKSAPVLVLVRTN